MRRITKVSEAEVLSVYVVVPRAQLEELIDSFPIDMQEVEQEHGRIVEVYSLGTKRQFLDFYKKLKELLVPSGC